MCSSGGRTAHTPAEVELAARLADAIEELAAMAGAGGDAGSLDIASRLAQAWAVITAADPELAARAASYSAS